MPGEWPSSPLPLSPSERPLVDKIDGVPSTAASRATADDEPTTLMKLTHAVVAANAAWAEYEARCYFIGGAERLVEQLESLEANLDPPLSDKQLDSVWRLAAPWRSSVDNTVDDADSTSKERLAIWQEKRDELESLLGLLREEGGEGKHPDALEVLRYRMEKELFDDS